MSAVLLPTLETLLQDPVFVEHFTRFLKAEQACENLSFILDCEAANIEDDQEKAQAMYNYIVRQYIDVTSERNVNIQALTRKQIEALKSLNQLYTFTDFTAAKGEIFLMLRDDVLPRFKKSTIYQEYLQVSRKNNGNHHTSHSSQFLTYLFLGEGEVEAAIPLLREQDDGEKETRAIRGSRSKP